MIMSGFWLWLRKYANKKVKKQYMEKWKHDRKCPQCNTWLSEVGGAEKFWAEGDYDYMVCKKCHMTSKWDCRGMLPDNPVIIRNEEKHHGAAT
jgi:hypothetical protein